MVEPSGYPCPSPSRPRAWLIKQSALSSGDSFRQGTWAGRRRRALASGGHLGAGKPLRHDSLTCTAGLRSAQRLDRRGRSVSPALPAWVPVGARSACASDSRMLCMAPGEWSPRKGLQEEDWVGGGRDWCWQVSGSGSPGSRDRALLSNVSHHPTSARTFSAFPRKSQFLNICGVVPGHAVQPCPASRAWASWRRGPHRCWARGAPWEHLSPVCVQHSTAVGRTCGKLSC